MLATHVFSRAPAAALTWSRVAAARAVTTFASLNGVPTDAATLKCSVWDVSFQRGDGVFEVCRVVCGPKLRCLELHLNRLERSAAAIELSLPPREDLANWIRQAASEGGDNGIVRCIITRGGGSAGYGNHLGNALDAPSSTFILWQPLPTPPSSSVKLLPMCAPWHAGGFCTIENDWAAIKWLSYGPNVHSTRLAQRKGYDDALLLARGFGVSDDSDNNNDNRVVLDGPNWAIAWKRNDGVFCTPSWRELGLLQSTSCVMAIQAAQNIGMRVEEGTYCLRDVKKHATSIWIMSTTRDLVPVAALGDKEFSTTDSTTRNVLLRAMDKVVAEYV